MEEVENVIICWKWESKAKQSSFIHCQTAIMCDEKTWKHTSLVDTRTKSKALSNFKNSHWKNLKTHGFKQEWKAKLDRLIVCNKPLKYKRWKSSTMYQATLELAHNFHFVVIRSQCSLYNSIWFLRIPRHVCKAHLFNPHWVVFSQS
jgi:hypothetical protein